MPLSWNEIRNRAHELSKRCEHLETAFANDAQHAKFLFERYRQLKPGKTRKIEA